MSLTCSRHVTYHCPAIVARALSVAHTAAARDEVMKEVHVGLLPHLLLLLVRPSRFDP